MKNTNFVQFEPGYESVSIELGHQLHIHQVNTSILARIAAIDHVVVYSVHCAAVQPAVVGRLDTSSCSHHTGHEVNVRLICQQVVRAGLQNINYIQKDLRPFIHEGKDQHTSSTAHHCEPVLCPSLRTACNFFVIFVGCVCLNLELRARIMVTTSPPLPKDQVIWYSFKNQHLKRLKGS